MERDIPGQAACFLVKGEKNTQSQVFTLVSLLTGEFVFTSRVLGPNQLNRRFWEGISLVPSLSRKHNMHNCLIYKEDCLLVIC